MTDGKIEKGLECCSAFPINDCNNCPYGSNGCKQQLLEDALTYINRQKDRIAELEGETVQKSDKGDDQ